MSHRGFAGPRRGGRESNRTGENTRGKGKDGWSDNGQSKVEEPKKRYQVGRYSILHRLIGYTGETALE